MDVFEKMVLNKAVTSVFLDKLVQLLPNKEWLLLLCMKYIGDNPNMMYMFEATTPSIANGSNIDTVLDKCIDPLLSSHGKMFSCLIEVVKSILTVNPDLARERADLIDRLLPKALTSEGDAQKSLFGICLALAVGPEARRRVRTVLEPVVTFKTDRFSYRASDMVRSPMGYSGLRNLGSTCYMNSVLQQLFHTPAFRYLVLTGKFDDNEAHKAIQVLFSEMICSQRRFADTERFAKVWKGWGNMPVNVREQQDANEFLQIFLDRFPAEMCSICRGEIENTIKRSPATFELPIRNQCISASGELHGGRQMSHK
jgi:hypothetical protein